MATNVIGCLCHQVISNHGFGIVECSCRPRGKISTAYAISVLGKYTRTCFYFPSNILKKTVVRYCSFQSMKEITIMRTQTSHYSDVIMSSRASQFTGVSIACRSKKTSKLRVTGLCEGNSPVTGEFPAQRASYADNVSIWWRHHDYATQRLSDHNLLCVYTGAGADYY